MFSVVDENFIQRPPKKKSDVVGRETVINLLVNRGQKFLLSVLHRARFAFGSLATPPFAHFVR